MPQVGSVSTTRARNHSGQPCGPGKRYMKLVKVTVNSVNQTQFNFPQDNILGISHILAVEVFSLADFATGPAGVIPVNATVFAKAFLNLYSSEGNEQVISQMPLERLRAANNAGETFKVCIPALNTGACNVEISSIASLVLNESFFIGIHYERKEAE